MSSDAAKSNVFDSLTLTSSEAPSHLHGCVSWGCQPFPLLTDRAGLLHLIETFYVTWDKILRVEFYQSLAGVGKVCFPTSYSHQLLLSHPTVTAAAPAKAENAEDFGFVLTIWSSSGSSPWSPNFQCADAVEKPRGSSICLLIPTSMALQGKPPAIRGKKEKRPSVTTALSEEIIQAASAEIFCCVTCISHRDFSWQDYVDHCFLNRDKFSQNLGIVSLQQINGWCTTYFNTSEKTGF